MTPGAQMLQMQLQTSRPQGPSWRALVALALAVLAAHLLLLAAAPLRLGSDSTPARASPPVAKIFSTRRIEQPVAASAAPSPTPPAPAPKVAKAKPVPRRAPTVPIDTSPLAPQPAPLAAPSENESNSASAQSNQAVTATDSGASVTESAEPASTAAAPTGNAPVSTQAPPASAAAAAVADALTPTVITSVKLADSVLLRYAMRGSSKGLDYHANAELSWRNLGADYEASMRVSAFLLGSRSMSSRGQITPGGLAPTRFSDKSRSEQAAHFDSSTRRITFSANTPDAPLLAGAQDRVSVFFQLAGILAAGPGNLSGATALPLGSQITIYTVGPREADTWTFVVEGEELLTLPAGEMVALKLTRKPRRQYDQTVEIWYAPSQAFMPVRSRITQANGDFVDQQLKAVEAP
ncbi:MAG: hypothetical protein JWP47_1124 [Polaromonas sp.]|nr:hypothetical protein [Polaromonas sp.]